MAQEVEIEFKNLLTKEEYELLLERLPFPHEGHKQVNYYFETSDFQLRNNKAALRIREKNGEYRLTLKEPYKDGLLETHDSLTKDEAEAWINGNPIDKEFTKKRLYQMGISVENLKCYGSLTTIRREYKDSGLIYVLDHSSYHDQEDYELEIESTDRESGLKALDTILKDWSIVKKETPNKIARFFNSLHGFQ
jgi:uncharacterized protein YjbK